MPHEPCRPGSIIIALLCALAPLTAARAGPMFKLLYTFKGTPSDGAVPLAGVLLGPGGVLFGTTSQGGPDGCQTVTCGTVYQLTPPAAHGDPWTEAVLYHFGGGDDGGFPESDLATDSSGTLYGTAYKYGLHLEGTAFALAPPGAGGSWNFSVMYAFGASDADGALPIAGLLAGPGGSFYGTTTAGGTAGMNHTQTGYGTVFQLSPPATPGDPWAHTKLYAFRTCCTSPQGATPSAGVLLGLPDGSLLDATIQGGSAGFGVAYDLAPPAGGAGSWRQNPLHAFTDAGSGGPNGDLVSGGGGVYYGTSSGLLYNGGPCHGTCGVVYQLTAPAGTGAHWTYTTLYRFKGDTDGATPRAGLVIGPGGVLYGTTYTGGDPQAGCFSNGCGTIFVLKPPAPGEAQWREKVLHRFVGTDGAYPKGRLVIDATGSLYGTASGGGTANSGTVFKLVP